MNPFIKFVFIIILICYSLVQAEEKLLIVAEDWPPFEFIENNEVVGIDIDIIRSIFNKINVPYEIQIVPWARAWKLIVNGVADISLTTSRKPERDPYVYYSNEDMWLSEYVFFVNQDNYDPNFNGYEDAQKKKLRIGIIRDNSYDPDFWKVFPHTPEGDYNAQLDAVRDPMINFLKLSKNRIDLYIMDKTVGLYIIKNNNFSEQITYYNNTLFAKGYPIAFSKKSSFPGLKDIADKFNYELILFKKSDEYQKIFNKWVGPHKKK